MPLSTIILEAGGVFGTAANQDGSGNIGVNVQNTVSVTQNATPWIIKDYAAEASLAVLTSTVTSVAGIAFVGGTSQGIFNVNSLTLTYTPQAGNEIIIGIDFDVSYADPGTVVCADNNGNALTLNASLINVTSWETSKMYQFYGTAVAGATSYIISWTNTTAVAEAVLGEWSGVGGVGTTGTTVLSTSSTATTASVTVTKANPRSWVVAVFDAQDVGLNTPFTGNVRESGSNSFTNIVLMDNSNSTCAGVFSVGTGSAWGAIALELLPFPSSVITTSVPATSGGCLTDVQQALTISAQVKPSAGQFYGFDWFNPNSVTVYVFIYDTTSAPSIGSTTNLIYQKGIPAGESSNQFFDLGISTSNGIYVAASTSPTSSAAPSTGLVLTTLYF